jgi:protease-4
MVAAIKERLKLAALDSDVKAVLLKVDSPGGEVLAADDIAREIAAFQRDTLKPVIATMGSMAASGGYYISAPCRWIVANELTITGSIGVIMHGWNYRALMDKVGIKPQIYKSGKFKDMLSGEKSPEEILPEENSMVQSLIDQTYARFTNVIALGRASSQQMNLNKGQPLARNWPQYADGRILSGKDALEYGFVDELGNFDTAVARAKNMTGISSANLIRYEQPFELSSLLRFFAKSDAKNLKIEFGPDLPKLQMGRLYFLMP